MRKYELTVNDDLSATLNEVFGAPFSTPNPVEFPTVIEPTIPAEFPSQPVVVGDTEQTPNATVDGPAPPSPVVDNTEIPMNPIDENTNVYDALSAYSDAELEKALEKRGYDVTPIG